jgi:capping protein beta
MSDQENEEQQQQQENQQENQEENQQQQQSNENENEFDQNQNQNPENQEPQEQPQEEYQEPPKTYAPPNPTIKECILLNQILPISNIDKNIDAISAVIYDNDVLLNEFLQKVDNRTEISNEDSEGPFIKCEQNRDGDSYRSPITNKYFPTPEENDGKFPSPNLRKLEEKLNKMFKVYTRSYYGSNAIVSCYCWDFTENIKDGFGVAVIIKNNINHENNINEAVWNSTNIVSVNFNENEGKIKANYNLVTNVSLIMNFDNKICGKVSLSGMVARNSHLDNKIVKDYVNDDAHIGNIGVLIEDLESNIRNTLDVIYVSKSKEIIDTARFNPTLGKPGIAQALKLKEAFMQGMKK